MTRQRNPTAPCIERAVAERHAMIVARSPEATCAVWQGEDPTGTYTPTSPPPWMCRLPTT
ncbi:MAG: hypothetical protein ACYDAR_02585 [Thermomicrobiales bacterium]